jgi:hypothetical protein
MSQMAAAQVQKQSQSSITLKNGVLQRNCDECRKKKHNLQLAAIRDAPDFVPPIVHEVLRAPGQPLDASTGAFMESRFGRDFSQVRVHTDDKAALSAHAVNASAYALGPHIAFADGKYQPSTGSGRRLIAHELTHVVQQRHHPSVLQGSPVRISSPADSAEREAGEIADALEGQGDLLPIAESTSSSLALFPLDIDSISADSDRQDTATFTTGTIPISISLLYLKYSGHASGEITKAADYPTTFTLPADKSKPVGRLPNPDSKPPLSNIPVEAHFFPTLFPAKGRALIIGGFHGDEQPGWQVTDALVNELSGQNPKVNLAFNTIIVPRLNAAAIQDELSGIKMWRNRCNRQVVDLNRNFPTGDTPKATDCVNTARAPIQPEVKSVMNIITKFKPDRILSTHAISNPMGAGIFADPNKDKKAIELARQMASTVVNPSDRPANRLGPGTRDFNPVYPGDRPGMVGAGTSLGAWAPTAVPNKTTSVITIEAPGFGALGTGPGRTARNVESFLRPMHAFIGDPGEIATAADRDILADIDAFNAADRISFLTGQLSKTNDIYRRIKLRVDTAIANLNVMNPPVPIRPLPNLRLFTEGVGGGSAQSKIDFEKFFLVGDRARGWDTLPDQFFRDGKREKGVDRAKWLATPSKDRLAIILKFSSLPGTSRHHWGTDVDFNSATVADWQPATLGKNQGRFFALGQWLQANASRVGLVQAYTFGRTGGYNEEPWHYSYAPISIGLRSRYNQQVNLQKDVIDKIMADFSKRAAASGQTMPLDLDQALKQINISDLVNNIGPGL